MRRQVIIGSALLIVAVGIHGQALGRSGPNSGPAPADSILDQRSDDSAWALPWGSHPGEHRSGSTWGRSDQGLRGSTWGRSDEGLRGSTWGRSDEGLRGSTWGRSEGGSSDSGLPANQVIRPASNPTSRAGVANESVQAPAPSVPNTNMQYFRIYELSPIAGTPASSGREYVAIAPSDNSYYMTRPGARSIDTDRVNYIPAPAPANLRLYETSPSANYYYTRTGPPAEAPIPMTHFATKTIPDGQQTRTGPPADAPAPMTHFATKSIASDSHIASKSVA